MSKIKITTLTDEEINKRGIKNWPIWEKEESSFPWSYDSEESCLLIEGDVTVKTEDEEVRFGAGNFVVFPRGLDCTWTIHKKVKKHYNFS